ncbi:hypothetical protein BDZ91DRAFT_713999 [Kalaharituber pfeilii]|nr:hypothetical protein BDZ91DRAFT_713999 [Kalaharituber pfeilii]
MECITKFKRLRGLRKTNYLMHRELFGDQNGAHRPPMTKKHLPRVSITKLDNGDLKRHIVVGERPTYPYHIVSIRKPSSWCYAEAGALQIDVEDGYTDGTGGSIVFWKLVNNDESTKEVDIRLQQVESHARMEPGIDYSDKHLASAFTAWDVLRDHCAQVLFWKGDHYSVLQFRYGSENCIIEIGRYTALVGACFLGLNHTTGNGIEYDDGAVVSAVFASSVYFYEPFGWAPGRRVPELRHWYTTSETLQDVEPISIGRKSFIPRVSVLKLDIFIRQFLTQKFSLQFATKQPQLQKMFSNYVRRKAGIRAGKQRSKDFETTNIAVGAVERVTGSYYFFLLQLDHTKRMVQPVIARALSSDESENIFSPENLSIKSGYMIFYEAIKRIIGGLYVDTGFLSHDCNRTCANIPGNMVKSLCRYHSEAKAMEEIRLDECGIILEGWRGASETQD